MAVFHPNTPPKMTGAKAPGGSPSPRLRKGAALTEDGLADLRAGTQGYGGRQRFMERTSHATGPSALPDCASILPDEGSTCRRALPNHTSKQEKTAFPLFSCCLVSAQQIHLPSTLSARPSAAYRATRGQLALSGLSSLRRTAAAVSHPNTPPQITGAEAPGGSAL